MKMTKLHGNTEHYSRIENIPLYKNENPDLQADLLKNPQEGTEHGHDRIKNWTSKLFKMYNSTFIAPIFFPLYP